MTYPNSIKAFSLVALLSLLSACASGPQQAQWGDALDAHLWVCDGQDVMQTRQAGEQLWLQLPNSDSWLELDLTRAASGSLYQNEQGTRFWNQGERARVFTPQKDWNQCSLEASGTPDELESSSLIAGTDNRPDALTLRVIGHHPGWLLEIRQKGEGQLSFNFGTETYPLTEIEQTDQDLIQRSYLAQLPDGEELRYQVDNVMCIDIKSGEPFQHRVEMTFQGQSYRGCGQSF